MVPLLGGEVEEGGQRPTRGCIHLCTGGNSWLLKGDDVGTRITMKPTHASRWQRLHASVSLAKALVKSALFLIWIALPRSARGGSLLYDRKTPITAADLLNDRVVPFFDSQEVKLLRVLTDRGSEYCGTPERHEYELRLPT
jgi:hypothetical protein